MVDDRLASAPQGASAGRDRLLTPGEVATLFRVDPKTVTRWAAAGRIGSIRTPVGHHRFRESEVRALLQDDVVEEMRGDNAANRPRNSGPSNPGSSSRSPSKSRSTSVIG